MKLIKDSVDNFYKWVHGSEFVELGEIDVTEDPVRPELDLEWRKAYSRKIYGLTYKNNIEGIICIAYCNDIPESVRELDLMSQNAHLQENFNTAVAYTVWSRKRGAGKEIMTKLLEFLQNKPEITKLVTLSPLTPVATHFHIKNGAKLVQHNYTTQNFEYKLKGSK